MYNWVGLGTYARKADFLAACPNPLSRRLLQEVVMSDKPCYRCKSRPRHYQSYCKECWRDIRTAWNNNNRAKRRESDRLSKRRTRKRDGPEETRRKWNDWYAKNREHRCAYRNKQRDKEKEKVYWIVRNARDTGILIRPERCSKCLDIRLVDAHHEDYSKPFEIKWLCRQCHSRLHNLKEVI